MRHLALLWLLALLAGLTLPSCGSENGREEPMEQEFVRTGIVFFTTNEPDLKALIRH